MLTSYHVHTTLSDGRDSLEDVVQAAIDMGLDELGISDHYILVSDRLQHGWGMPMDGLGDYWNTVQAAARHYAGEMVIRCGLEADYDPITVDELAGILRPYSFDYIIGSIHFVDSFPIDRSAEDWDSITQDKRNEIIRTYWVRIRQIAESRLFDIVGHIDLYRKFDHFSTADLSQEISAALDAIAEAGMAVELNTAPLYRPDTPSDEPYPQLKILQDCYTRGIPTLISSDAHYAKHLIANFDKAEQILRNAGYTQKAVYRQRKMRLIPLG